VENRSVAANPQEADMQYLVTMTTQVPGGVSDAEVAGVRARESVRSAELVAAGHLLRLWRPPLQPGEWRTLGLFEAADEIQLEEVLASMPLRIWRHDEVTPLLPHANDPASPTPLHLDWTEYFTTFTLTIPDGADSDAELEAEASSTRRLAAEGKLVRLWRLPSGQALGLWQSDDAEELQKILDTLPLAEWLQTDLVPLTTHPSDPAHATPTAPA
jgi:muconolactone delta-isomerase